MRFQSDNMYGDTYYIPDAMQQQKQNTTLASKDILKKEAQLTSEDKSYSLTQDQLEGPGNQGKEANPPTSQSLDDS